MKLLLLLYTIPNIIYLLLAEKVNYESLWLMQLILNILMVLTHTSKQTNTHFNLEKLIRIFSGCLLVVFMLLMPELIFGGFGRREAKIEIILLIIFYSIAVIFLALCFCKKIIPKIVGKIARKDLWETEAYILYKWLYMETILIITVLPTGGGLYMLLIYFLYSLIFFIAIFTYNCKVKYIDSDGFLNLLEFCIRFVLSIFLLWTFTFIAKYLLENDIPFFSTIFTNECLIKLLILPFGLFMLILAMWLCNVIIKIFFSVLSFIFKFKNLFQIF
jgi:hypothetical protein